MNERAILVDEGFVPQEVDIQWVDGDLWYSRDEGPWLCPYGSQHLLRPDVDLSLLATYQGYVEDAQRNLDVFLRTNQARPS